MLLNTKEDWQPEQSDIIQWSRTYRAVNVDQELMAMESWLDANPNKRKTKAGIKRFVNSWLARAQNQGGSPIAKKSSKNGSIRAKSIDMQMTDVSWLENEEKTLMKNFYLQKFGFYYDGDLKNE
jgi:hypothetical protein